LERPGERPAGALLGVARRVVAENQLQDPGLGELAECGTCELALLTGGLMLLVARMLVTLEPHDCDRAALSRVARVPELLPGGPELGHHLFVAAAKLD